MLGSGSALQLILLWLALGLACVFLPRNLHLVSRVLYPDGDLGALSAAASPEDRMSIPTLPLVFVGWFFAILCFAALAIGVMLLHQLFCSGKIPPAYLQSRFIGDIALLLVWLIGLASAFGLLNGFSWGRIGLEYFCWVLIALTLLSGGTRLAAYRQHPQGQGLTRRGWAVAVSGVMLVALTLLALCSATILTMCGDQTHAQSEQMRRR